MFRQEKPTQRRCFGVLYLQIASRLAEYVGESDLETRDIRVIINPAAAKGKAEKALPRIVKLLKHHRLSFDIVKTERPWHAAEAAEEAARLGYGIVAAAGGDGTCNEVANGIMNYGKQGTNSPEKMQTALAVLPIGRGNDFAYSAGIPRTLEGAVALLAEGGSRPCDVGQVTGGDYPEGRYFINGLGIGFEPLVNLTASQYPRLSGMLSYIAAVGKIMMNYPEAIPVILREEGHETRVQTQQISICNGRRMGGAFLLGPDALIDDGQLDLCYVNRPVAGGTILYLVTRFFRGTQKSHSAISSGLIGSMEIVTEHGEKTLICHIDGEMISTGTDLLQVHVFSRVLRVISRTE